MLDSLCNFARFKWVFSFESIASSTIAGGPKPQCTHQAMPGYTEPRGRSSPCSKPSSSTPCTNTNSDYHPKIDLNFLKFVARRRQKRRRSWIINFMSISGITFSSNPTFSHLLHSHNSEASPAQDPNPTPPYVYHHYHIYTITYL